MDVFSGTTSAVITSTPDITSGVFVTSEATTTTAPCDNGSAISLQPIQAVVLFAVAFGIGVFLALIVHFRTIVGMVCRRQVEGGGGGGDRLEGTDEGGTRREERRPSDPPCYEMALTMPRPAPRPGRSCYTTTPVLVLSDRAACTGECVATGSRQDPPPYDLVIHQLGVNSTPPTPTLPPREVLFHSPRVSPSGGARRAPCTARATLQQASLHLAPPVRGNNHLTDLPPGVSRRQPQILRRPVVRTAYNHQNEAPIDMLAIQTMF